MNLPAFLLKRFQRLEGESVYSELIPSVRCVPQAMIKVMLVLFDLNAAFDSVKHKNTIETTGEIGRSLWYSTLVVRVLPQEQKSLCANWQFFITTERNHRWGAPKLYPGTPPI